MALRVANNSSLAAALLTVSILHGAGPVISTPPAETLAAFGTDDPPDFLHGLLEGNGIPHTIGKAEREELHAIRLAAAKRKEFLLLLVSPSDKPDTAYWGWWSVGPIGRYMIAVLWGWGTEDQRPVVPRLRLTGDYILITREQQAAFLAQEALIEADMGHFVLFPQ